MATELEKLLGTKKEIPGQDSKSNLLGALVAGGLALTAHKAKKDFTRIFDKTKSFNKFVKDKAFAQKSPIAQGVAAAKAYGEGGQDLINQTVLGLKIPYIGTQGAGVFYGLKANKYNPFTTAKKYIDGGLLKDYHKQRLINAEYVQDKINHGQKLNLFENLFYKAKSNKHWDDLKAKKDMEIPAKGTHAHYSKFKNAPKNELDAYNIYGDLYKSVNPETEKLIRSYGPDNVTGALLDLKRSGKSEDYAAAVKYFRGLRNKYAGSSPLGSGGGNSQNYENVANLIMPSLIGGSGLLRNTALAGSGFFGAKELKDQIEKRSNITEDLPEIAGLGAGTSLALGGINDIRRPLRVGVSWSELGRHGEGHKNPGKSMYETFESLKKNPEFKNLDLINAARDATNNYDRAAYAKKFDVFADAGMGPTSIWDWDKGDAPGTERRNIRAKVAPGGFVGYMTDIGGPGSPHEGYKYGIDSPLRRAWQKLGIKDNYIQWGPKDLWEQGMNPNTSRGKDFYKKFNTYSVSSQGMPTLTQKASDILQDLQGKSRKDVIEAALKNPMLNDQQKNLLKNLGDKKLIFVTGSGRGDYVGSRLREYRRELKRAGLSDKYQIAGMLGGTGNLNPISKSLRADKNLLLFDKLPQDLYIGLPGVADFHDISTGTSALMESTGSRANLGVRNNWERIKQKERKLFDRLERRGVKLDPEFKDMHNMVALDAWNRGNREFVKQQPSVKGFNSTKEIVSHLEKLKPEDYANAEARSFRQNYANQLAKENMNDVLANVLRNQKNLKLTKGIAKSLGGLGLGAGAVYSAMQSRKPKLENNLNPDKAITDLISQFKLNLKNGNR
jgi:hypothetical protein